MNQVDIHIPGNHWLSVAVEPLRPRYSVEEKFNGQERFLINFMGANRFTEQWYFDNGINIHPAPPEYPGVGVATRALMDRAKTFGVTVHRIAPEYDSGKILHVSRFPIREGITCDALYAEAELEALRILPFVIEQTAKHGVDWPDAPDEKWGKYVGRKEFDRIITATGDPNGNTEAQIDALVRCARHPTKPGPYVIIGGHKFAYCHE